MKFARIFDLDDDNQVLVVKDGTNTRLTVSTLIGDKFRTMAPKLEDTPFTVDALFDNFTKEMAVEIREEMKEIDFDNNE